VNPVFSVVDFTSGWAPIERAWGDLYRRTSNPCAFYHPAFLHAASALPEALRPTHLVLGHHGDSLEFAVPTRIIRVPPLGGRCTEIYAGPGFDHVAPLDASDDGSHTAAFLLGGLDTVGVDCLNAAAVATAFRDSVRQGLAATGWSVMSRHGFRCPFLALPASSEGVLAGLSSKFRKNVQYCLRRADREGVEFRVRTGRSDATETLQASLADLARLHGLRFTDKDEESVFLSDHMQDFHHRVCGYGDRNTVLFTEAVRDGRVVGSLYGFCAGTRFSFFQHGFDPDLGHLSLGSLLIVRTMEHLVAGGYGVFDFLRGADAYKSKWTETHVVNHHVLAGRRVQGRLTMETLRLNRARKRHGRLQGFLARIRDRDL